MQGKTAWISLGVFIAILGIGAFLLGRQNIPSNVPEAPAPTPVPTSTVEEGNVEVETDEQVTEITIEGEEFSFSPSTATVEAGRIRLTFLNMGAMQHDLVFEDLAVAVDLVSAGESDTIEFTIDEPGTYTFYCSVNGHRQLGMEGQLIVE